MSAVAGWYPNPNDPTESIWWDGNAWAMNTTRSTDSASELALPGNSQVARVHDAAAMSYAAMPTLSIGDIGVSPTMVVTPNGTAPLAGTRWIVSDQTMIDRKTPTWAIVLAILLVWFFLFSLLLLFVKEEVTRGFIQIQVYKADGTFLHQTQIPVYGSHQALGVKSQVAQAQAMALTAGWAH